MKLWLVLDTTSNFRHTRIMKDDALFERRFFCGEEHCESSIVIKNLFLAELHNL